MVIFPSRPFLAVLLMLSSLVTGLFAQNHFAINFQAEGSCQIESVIPTNDGGVAFAAGYAYGGLPGIKQGVVGKLDSNANLQWSRTVFIVERSGIIEMVATNDGGYFAAGGGIVDSSFLNIAMVVKMDANGTTQWLKGIADTVDITTSSAIQTDNGDFVITGSCKLDSTTEVWAARYDPSGNLLWSKVYGGIGNEKPYSVIERSNGNLLIVGITNSFGAGMVDALILELDSQGNISKVMACGSANRDYGWDLVETSDGGIAVVGESPYYAMTYEGFVVKLDANLNLDWGRLVYLSQSPAGYDRLYGVAADQNGGIVICGESNEYPGGAVDTRMTLVKLDSDGNLNWGRGHGHGIRNFATAVSPLPDGGLVLGGGSYLGTSGTWASIYTLDSTGQGCLPSIGNFRVDSISPSLVQGSFTASNFGFAVPLTDTSINQGTLQVLCSGPVSSNETIEMPLLTIAPNPFHSSTRITANGLQMRSLVQCFDASGRMVREFELSPGQEYMLEKGDWAPGLYRLVLTNAKQRSSCSVMVLHG